MIKQNILSVIIPTLLISGPINAAEIYNKEGNKFSLYGEVVGLHYFSGNNNIDGDQTYANLGLSGETQINNQLISYGRFEYKLLDNYFGNKFESQNGNKTIFAYAGLKVRDYGSFDYGCNYGIIYDALRYTDVLPEFGGDTTYNHNFFTGHINGVATYRNANFFGLVNGLNFGIQYLGKNEYVNNHPVKPNESDNLKKAHSSNGDGWGTSISYGFDGFSVIGAYSAADRVNLQQETSLRGKGNKAEKWVTGIKYDADNIYLAANYGETRNATPIDNGFANKTQDVLLVAQYQFDFGLRPSIGYIQSKAEDIETIGDEDLVKYIEIGASYYFNENTSTYLDYKINQINDNNKLKINSKDTVAMGIKYRF